MQLMSNAAFVLVFCAAMVANMELIVNGSFGGFECIKYLLLAKKTNGITNRIRQETNKKLPASKKIVKEKRFAVPKKQMDNEYKFHVVAKRLDLHFTAYDDYVNNRTWGRVEMYNDSIPVITVSIDVIKDFPPTMMIQMRGYRFTETNQWILFFDKGLQYYCDFVENNVSFMQNVLKASNFTECPVKKGKYSIKNMVIDEKALPPGLPEGKFLVDAIFTVEGKRIVQMSYYADVELNDEDYD